MRRSIKIGFIFVLGWVSSWAYFNFFNGQLNSIIPIASTEKVVKEIPKFPPGIAGRNEVNLANTTRIKIVEKLEYDRASALLENGQYVEFVQSLSTLRGNADEKTISQYRRLLLNTVHQLEKNNNIIAAIKLLNLYVEYEYDDVDILILLATLHEKQSNALVAIDTLYKAKSYAHRSEKIAELTKQIRIFTQAYQSRLKKQGDDLGLLALYTRLTELEPEYAPNYIGLAQSFVTLGNHEDARLALSIVSHDPEVSGDAFDLLELMNHAQPLDLSSSHSIPLIRFKDQFVLDVVLNNSVNVKLLLDTGASLSTISPEVLAWLGITTTDAKKKSWFNTANGVVESYIYTLRSLSLGGNQAVDIDVAVMDVSSSENIQGLLGMNYLKNFKFYIDQEKNILYLQ